MTSPPYPLLEKFIADEWVQLERNHITPWVFLTAGPPFRCRDFYGKDISYDLDSFEGSPRDVFWGRYIEPFLEDITQRAIQETLRLASEKRQCANEPLIETSGLLKSVAKRAYDRMAVIDQHIQSELAMTRRRYKINDFYGNHPFLFWFFSFLIGAIGLMVAVASM